MLRAQLVVLWVFFGTAPARAAVTSSSLLGAVKLKHPCREGLGWSTGMQTGDSEVKLAKAEFCSCPLKEVGSKSVCATSESNSFSSERSFSEQIVSSSSSMLIFPFQLWEPFCSALFKRCYHGASHAPSISLAVLSCHIFCHGRSQLYTLVMVAMHTSFHASPRYDKSHSHLHLGV